MSPLFSYILYSIFEFTLSIADIDHYLELHTAIRITEIIVPTLSIVDIEHYLETHTAIRITEIIVPTLVLEENIYKV